jgi:hypothetical protein
MSAIIQDKDQVIESLRIHSEFQVSKRGQCHPKVQKSSNWWCYWVDDQSPC